MAEYTDHNFDDDLRKYVQEIHEYFKRAVTPMLVLELLQGAPMYPFQLNKELCQRSQDYYTTSCYPTINRLLKENYIIEAEIIVSENGSKRQTYKLTDLGQAALEKLKEEYTIMNTVIEQILSRSGG